MSKKSGVARVRMDGDWERVGQQHAKSRLTSTRLGWELRHPHPAIRLPLGRETGYQHNKNNEDNDDNGEKRERNKK